MTREERAEWAEIKRQVAVRDKHRCQRCYDRVTSGATAHHILPRAEGGGNQLSNLVWLCDPCHDFVEIQEPPLRNRTQIEGSIAPYVHFSEPKARPWQTPGYDLSADLDTMEDHPTPLKRPRKVAQTTAGERTPTKMLFSWGCPPCGVAMRACPTLAALVRAEFAHRKKHHPLP